VNGELLSLMGDDLPWKVTLGRDAVAKIFTLSVNDVSFMQLAFQ